MNWLLILGAYSIISSVLIIQVNVVRSGGVPTVRGDGARKRYSRYNETVRGARSPRSGLALRDRPPSADSGTRESRVSGVVRAAVRLTFAHRRRQAEVALVLFTRRVQFLSDPSLAVAVPYSQGTLPHLCRHRVLHTQKGTMSQTRYLRHQLSYKWCSRFCKFVGMLTRPLGLCGCTWLGATRVRSIKKRPVPQLDPSQLALWPPSLRSVAAPLRWKKGASAFVAKARPRRGRAQHLFQKVCSHSEMIFRCTVKSATAPACAWSEVWSSKSHWP